MHEVDSGFRRDWERTLVVAQVWETGSILPFYARLIAALMFVTYVPAFSNESLRGKVHAVHVSMIN